MLRLLQSLQVLQELPLIASDKTAGDFAAHALRCAVGEICARGDQAAISNVSALMDAFPADVLMKHAPLILSHGLWRTQGGPAGIREMAETLLPFVDNMLATGEPSDACKTGCNPDLSALCFVHFVIMPMQQFDTGY